MTEYIKRQEQPKIWVVEVRFPEGGTDPGSPRVFATEEAADEWIAHHKAQHDVGNE